MSQSSKSHTPVGGQSSKSNGTSQSFHFDQSTKSNTTSRSEKYRQSRVNRDDFDYGPLHQGVLFIL